MAEHNRFTHRRENVTDYRKNIKKYLEQEIEVLKNMDLDSVNIVMNELEASRLAGSNIFICGNGGSAATASHFVCDFNKGVSLTQEKKYRFICLNDNIPSMMAIANDMGYEQIFEIPLKGKLKKEDLLIAISGSGNSENVVRAVRYAKGIGAKVIGMTGYHGGKIGELADYQLHVPICDMQVTEDVHMILDHLMMKILSENR